MDRKVIFAAAGLFLASPGYAHDKASPATGSSDLPDLVAELQEPMARAVKVRNQGQSASVGTRVLIGCKPRTLPSAPPNEDCALGAEYSNFDDTEVNTVASIDLPPLAPGETVSVDVPYWRLMALGEERVYHFKITVDPDQVVDESDTNNNVARSYFIGSPVDTR